MLYALIAAPFVAALLAAFGSGKDASASARVGLVLALAIAGLALPLVICMPNLAVSVPWFNLWGTGATVHLSLASDGLSAWLIQLVTLLTPIAIFASRDSVGGRIREFTVAVLVMEGLMIGALLARDLVLFYVCYEAMLIPMVVLIALFGSAGRRGAALQFFLYTMFGSVFMLVGIWYIASQLHTTDLAEVVLRLPTQIIGAQQFALFVGFVLAFAVKVPMVPLHGWQARTYAEAPAGAVVLLAGAMAKLGCYGFLRFVLPMFPQLSAQYAPVFIALGLVAVVGGALVALAQHDVKRLMAYSSLSHLGLVMVGIFTFNVTALNGAAVQMVAHGLSVAALFLLIGQLESRSPDKDRAARGIDDYGGLVGRAPIFAVLFVAAALASAALPGTANFAGESLLLAGPSAGAGPWVAAIAGLSTILGAVYLLRLVQRWLYGPRHPSLDGLSDLTPREILAVTPLLALSLFFGFYPRPISAQAGPVAERLTAPARDAAAALRPKPVPAAPTDPAAKNAAKDAHAAR